MRAEHELERLFLDAADGELSGPDRADLDQAVREDPAVKARLEAYLGTVQRLRAAPPLRAPQALAAQVLRRTRRRRFQLRRGEGEDGWRVPAEVLLPVLLGVLAALLLLLGAA
jgi:anti-sigma factor RsiW